MIPLDQAFEIVVNAFAADIFHFPHSHTANKLVVRGNTTCWQEFRVFDDAEIVMLVRPEHVRSELGCRPLQEFVSTASPPSRLRSTTTATASSAAVFILLRN